MSWLRYRFLQFRAWHRAARAERLFRRATALWAAASADRERAATLCRFRDHEPRWPQGP